MKHQFLDILILTLCSFLFLLSCSGSGDDPVVPDTPKVYTVTITLPTPVGMHAYTKADNSSADVDSEEDFDYERNIRNWLILVYDNSGVLLKYLSSDGNSDITSVPDSETQVEFNLEEGNYTFYAFANLESLENGTSIKTQITAVGCSETMMKSLTAKVGNVADKYTKNKSLIPMSSYGYSWPLQGDANLSIPLIRMIGKVRVTIQNGLDQDVTVNKISFGNFQERDIDLLPYGENKYLEFRNNTDTDPNRGPSFGGIGKSQSEEYTLPYDLPLSGGGLKITGNGGKVEGDDAPYCYVNESFLGSNTSSSPMTITVTRSSASESNMVTTHQTDFDFVRRNDLLEIPILLTKMVSTLTFTESRVPIGGLPYSIQLGDQSLMVLTPLTYTVQNSGDLKIGFILSDPTGGTSSDWKIRYENGGVAGKSITTLNLQTNEQNLLIDPETNGNYTAYPASLAFTEKKEHGGTFVVRTQELSKSAIAQIKFTLVVEYTPTGETNKREITIPYTLLIRNKAAKDSSES